MNTVYNIFLFGGGGKNMVYWLEHLHTNVYKDIFYIQVWDEGEQGTQNNQYGIPVNVSPLFGDLYIHCSWCL